MLAIQPTDNSQQLSLATALPDFIRTGLNDCFTLPTLPSAAAQILNVARSPNASVKAYADAIQTDPILTMRLLALANSAYYARSAPVIHSCREAVARIGLDTTLATTLSFNLFKEKDKATYLQRVWSRSLIAAIAARYMAEQLCPGQAGFVFTAALLQDIGVLALKTLYPDDVEAIYEPLPAHHTELSHAEHLLFGCDHAAVGAWLAAKWGVPTPLAEAISTSHSDYTAAPIDLFCVRLSGHIADAWLAPSPAHSLASLMRKLKKNTEAQYIELAELLAAIEKQLPSLAEILEITAPKYQDSEALLTEAQHLLFQQTLALNARLEQQQSELANLRKRQNELEVRNRIDALTGLANRGWMEEQLNEYFAQCREEGGTLSVLFIDLDYFKEINDRYGHLVGDVILENFGKLIRAMISESDLAGRFGGEEFLIITPDENAHSAQLLAKRIAHQLAEQPIALVENQPIHITVSIGVACLCDGGFADSRELINAADQTMYFIKHSGRSGIAVYGH
jgi:diguanylate cyclase